MVESKIIRESQVKKLVDEIDQLTAIFVSCAKSAKHRKLKDAG
ncbi:hypothetical protein [Kovacikia minuta]|nr:hypothetical protein [Kovacikia minuta]